MSGGAEPASVTPRPASVARKKSPPAELLLPSEIVVDGSTPKRTRQDAPSNQSPVVVNVVAAVPDAMPARGGMGVARWALLLIGLCGAGAGTWLLLEQRQQAARAPGASANQSPVRAPRAPEVAVSLDDLRARNLYSPPPEEYATRGVRFQAVIEAVLPDRGWVVFPGQPKAFCKPRPQSALYQTQPGTVVEVRARLKSVAPNGIGFYDCRRADEAD